MYHVYCEAADTEVLTPDWPDAERQFRRLCREYPNEVVDLDRLHDFVDRDDYGRRERIVQNCPF